MSTAGGTSAYHSQTTTDGSPRSVMRLLINSRPPTPQQQQQPRMVGNIESPEFRTTDPDDPTRNELDDYAAAVAIHVNAVTFLLNFLGSDPLNWPPVPDTLIDRAVITPVQIWRAAQTLGAQVAAYDKHVADVKLETARNDANNIRQASLAATPGASSGGVKIPMLTKFEGKKGDSAFTFIAGCNNYHIMKPGSFTSDEVFIRWALQQMDEKAEQWAVRQMMRMDTELDNQGRCPKELRKWKNFCEYFLTQFGDPRLIEKAQVKWKNGLTQTGKAVNYFEEIESILLQLNYPRDSEMTLDQVIAGLKTHIHTQFIGRQWASLNDMKREIIPYDSAYWEINKATGERTKTNASGSKATNTTKDRGKSQTPHVKTEIAKAGGTNRHFLPQEEFNYCKKNRLCFMCKANGVEIVGLARFHPNHLPQTMTKNKDKEEKKTKIAATDGKEKEQDSGSDTDCEQSKN